jgi:hyaluronoglucosaminidase
VALIAGVIEGFYGPPWSHADRLATIDLLAEHGGNWYVWAPKAAPRHRDAWREPFSADEIDEFGGLARRRTGVRVSVGLTPGPDATTDEVIAKLQPVVDARVQGLTLCFDDVPELDAASRHRDLANTVRRTFGVPVWLVPTHYAGGVSSPYLERLIDGLDHEILVMWTGSHVVCDTISEADVAARRRATGDRPPLVWDNTPVNDALMTEALHLGPYSGRDATIRSSIAGVLVNPMEFARASWPTIVSALAWCRGDDAVQAWDLEIDRLGLRVLAEATAFPDDEHWPGARPERAWWSEVAALDTEAITESVGEGVRRWVDAARDGAALALRALDLTELDVSERRALAQFGLALATREWERRPALTFGGGPRIRPVAANDEAGRFVMDPRSVSWSTSLVADLVRRALAQSAS